MNLRIADESVVGRFFYNLKLSHKRGAIVTDRLTSANGRSNIPFLDNHNSDRVIGVVEEVKVTARTSYAKVRFSQNEHAQEVKADIEDGIRLGVSPGIEVLEAELTEAGEGYNNDTYTATKWEILEVSSAPVPANGGAAALSYTFSQNEEQLSSVIAAARQRYIEQSYLATKVEYEDEEDGKEAEEASQEGEPTAEPAAEEERQEEVTETNEEAAEMPEETTVENRVKEIIELGRQHGKEMEALSAVEDGSTVASFKDKLLSIQFQAAPVVDTKKLNEDSDTFNFARWMRSKVLPDQADLRRLATFDTEYLANYESDIMRKNPERQLHGNLVPFKALAPWINHEKYGGRSHRREDLAATTTAANSSADLVDTTIYYRDLIWPFLSTSFLIPRITVYSGLVGNVDIPVVDTEVPTVDTAISEGSGLAAAVAAVFTNKTLTPNTMGGRVEITRRLMTQTDGMINGIIMTMFDRQFTHKLEQIVIDSVMTNGTKQEVPAARTKLVSSTASESFMSIAFATLLEMRQLMNEENIPMDRVLITGSDIESECISTLKTTGVSGYIFENKMFYDIPTEISTRIEGDGSYAASENLGVILLVPSEVILGLWEGIDFIMNRDEATGNFRISAFLDYDTEIKHAKAARYLQRAAS